MAALADATRSLERGDIASAAKHVFSYGQNLKWMFRNGGSMVNDRYVQYITQDGYKFLTKNAAYILEQLSSPYIGNNFHRSPLK